MPSSNIHEENLSNEKSPEAQPRGAGSLPPESFTAQELKIHCGHPTSYLIPVTVPDGLTRALTFLCSYLNCKRRYHVK